jgi:hypothetical protein
VALAKASFQRLSRFLLPEGAPVDVLFNPTELTFTKAAQIAEVAIPGLDMPILQFVHGQTETLTIDLFFDTTDYGTGDVTVPVTNYTDQFYQLIKINRQTHAPPVCQFRWTSFGFPGWNLTDQWSTQSRYNFQCIVESVRQRFTLFAADGTPLRATLTVSLREYKSLQQQIAEIRFESPNHTQSHVVASGETLSSIANASYADPAQWRVIADANQIDDPLDLRPGDILEIPPLR